MSIPELVRYNNKCKRLDEYFLKGKPLKTPRSGGVIRKKGEKPEIEKIEKQEDEKIKNKKT